MTKQNRKDLSPEGMKQHCNLKNHLLVAMPDLDDTNFAHTVTYICEHNADGAMGLIINKVTDMSLGEMLDQLDIDNSPEAAATPVFFGGPVEQERGFILHSMDNKRRQRWEYTLPVAQGIGLTLSKDILFDIAHDQGPANAILTLGYAGWDAGQLEQEMADNAWISVPANHELIFNTPCEEMARKALAVLGICPERMSRQAGHA